MTPPNPPNNPHAPPPLRLLWQEALVGWHWLRARFTPRALAAEANGQPVMILPGFMAGDWSTRSLRADLARAGFTAYGWGLGWNRGATADIVARIDAQVDAIIAATGCIPALVGWSLGGIYAREYAKHHPAKVARVVTLGAPFSGSRRANRAWRLYHLVARHPVENPPIELHPAAKPPVPTFALWSARDGVVAADSARGLPDESDRQIKVDCTHMSFAFAPASVAAIVQALRDEADESLSPNGEGRAALAARRLGEAG